MGLDKDTASARISRYESGSMSISLEALSSWPKHWKCHRLTWSQRRQACPKPFSP